MDLLQKDPNLMVTHAMRAAGFSLEESRDRAKQMWIRRRIPSKKERKVASQLLATTTTTTVSPQSTSVVVGTPRSATLPVAQASDGAGWIGVHGNHAVDDEFECKLQDWISFHHPNNMGGKCGQLVDLSVQRKYLEQTTKILLSLGEKIVGNKMLDIGQTHLITMSKVIVMKSTALTILDGNLAADFITTNDDSPFCHECEVDDTMNKYAAMHAFARIAYAICLGDRGPILPDFIARNVTVSESSTSIALSLRDSSNESANGEEEDEIMDMIRKHYRANEWGNVNGNGYISAMLDSGIPLPMVRFISDLLGDEHGVMFRSARAFSSFEDVLSDLKQMTLNPDRFLHGTSSDRWKIVFDDKLYGRDAATEALMATANQVTCVRDIEQCNRLSRLARKKSEVVMVSGHSGAGKSRLVRVGAARLEKLGWLFLRCKFDRVGEFKLSSRTLL